MDTLHNMDYSLLYYELWLLSIIHIVLWQKEKCWSYFYTRVFFILFHESKNLTTINWNIAVILCLTGMHVLASFDYHIIFTTYYLINIILCFKLILSVILGYFTLFAFLTTFCWLNVICFDIYWMLRYVNYVPR